MAPLETQISVLDESPSQPTMTPFQPKAATPTMHPTVTAQATLTPTMTLTPTQPACQETQGALLETEISLEGYSSPMAYILYLPPCYQEELPERGYPLLILLHGQTYTPQQWIDIGLPDQMDQLIGSGDIEPFVVVMPYESAAFEVGFHIAITDGLVPALQAAYGLCTGRECLAIGGISRGGGWALTAAFKEPEWFISLGLHSTPTSQGHLDMVRYSAATYGAANLPRIYVDYGMADYWYSSEKDLVDTFDASGVSYDFHLNEGSHDNTYWAAHLQDYLRWYAQGWQ